MYQLKLGDVFINTREFELKSKGGGEDIGVTIGGFDTDQTGLSGLGLSAGMGLKSMFGGIPRATPV